MRLDKIYTKTGDGGRTSLVTGERVAKSALRVEAFGAVDEVNSCVGLLRTGAGDATLVAIREEAERSLRQIQNDLFDVGSVLASAPARARDVLPEFPESRATFLEEQIDRYQASLSSLTSFVLPGGSMLNAHAHLARTVCRRAERDLWRLAEAEEVPAAILVYLNRLSDYFFVFSRWVLNLERRPEYLWMKGRGAGG